MNYVVKIGSTQIQGDVKYFKTSNTRFQGSCELEIWRDPDAPLTWTPYASKICVWDPGGVLRFVGFIYDHTPTNNINHIVYKIVAWDRRYILTLGGDDEALVYESYQKGTSLKQAITDIFTNYVNDAIGTIDVDNELETSVSLSGMTPAEAIKALLVSTPTEMSWICAYDEGTGVFTHSIERSWTTSAGVVNDDEYYATLTGDFKVNRNELKTVIEVTSPNMRLPDPHVQIVLYRNYDFTKVGSTGYSFPLAKPPNNIRAYLLYGAWDGDAGKLISSTHRAWFPIEPYEDDPEAAKVIMFDPDAYLSKSTKVSLPDYNLSGLSSVLYKENYQSSLSASDVSNNAFKVLYSLLEPDITAKLQVKGVDVPTMYIPTLQHLKKYMKQTNKEMGINIDPGEILGVIIENDVTYTAKRTFTADDSVLTDYGRRVLKIQYEADDVRELEEYGEALLAYHSTPKEEGEVTIWLWKNGTKCNTIELAPGDIYDLDHLLRGTKTGIKCDEVVLTGNHHELTCTAKSTCFPVGSLPQLLAQFTAKSLKDEQTAQEYVITEEVGVSDETEVIEHPVSEAGIWAGQKMRELHFY